METETKTKTRWRQHAIDMGINPDEPDDFRYWQQFDRKQAIVESFRYHQPSEAQIARIADVRKGHIALAHLIMRSTPDGADQTAALRKLHECMMTANKAIVCEVAP
jgi:hypothetical protein